MNQKEIEAYIARIDSEITLMLSYTIGENERDRVLLQVLKKEYDTLVDIITKASKDQMKHKYYDYHGFCALLEFIKKFMKASEKRRFKKHQDQQSLSEL